MLVFVGGLIAGMAAAFGCVYAIRSAASEDELWPPPLDPRSRAITMERLDRIRQNEAA